MLKMTKNFGRLPMKKVISLIVAMTMLLICAVPVTAFAGQSAPMTLTVTEDAEDSAIVAFFRDLFSDIRSFFRGIGFYVEVKSE